eukprot:12007098-Karenia_brevis.AAC.1
MLLKVCCDIACDIWNVIHIETERDWSVVGKISKIVQNLKSPILQQMCRAVRQNRTIKYTWAVSQLGGVAGE